MTASLAAMLAEALLMIGLPLVLWTQAIRRFSLGRHGWAVVGFGCLFFILSQFVNAPLRAIVVAAGLGGTSAGLAAFALVSGIGEECARYVAMRLVPQIREGLDRRVAIVYGLGHGGFESLALGLAVLATVLAIRNAGDPAALAQLPDGLAAQARAIAATPWYVFLAGVVERVFAIALHVGLSLIVMQAVLRRAPALLVLAIVWHAVANGAALALQQSVGNVVLTELWVAIAAGAAIAYGLAGSDSSRTAEAA